MIMADVLDLMVHEELRKTTIMQRIDRRIAVLSDWLENGVPPGKFASLPASLTEAREWQDDELGIEQIPSPRTFTKVHSERVRGEKVALIEQLYSDIRKKWGEPRRNKSGRRLTRSRGEEAVSATPWTGHSACEACLRRAANNYHVVKAQLDDARVLNESDIDRLAEKDKEIARLTKELAEERRSNLRGPRPA